MRRLACLALLLLSTSSSSFAGDTDAVDAVRKMLRDPDSAKFADVRPTTGTNNKGKPVEVVCGTVNAKTKGGGYLGARGFVYIPPVKRAFIERAAPIAEDAVNDIVGSATVRKYCP
jgi:hypothetical protein